MSLRKTGLRNMNLRNMAERLSRGVVLRRRLPAKFGRLPIYVTPEAGLRYWSSMSRVDSVLYRMAEEMVKPGSVVWDVGANVGLFSFCAALAGPSGSVLAIEPDVWLAHLINRSSQRLALGQYACAKVEVLCASASDSNHVSTLAIAERARASNFLVEAAGSTQATGARRLQPTPALTLDFLLNYFPAPTVVKIDAETHEANILKGAQRLLQQARPTIWCEVSAENSEDVTKLLRAANYQMYGAQVVPHRLINKAWFHTLAVPAERTADS